MPRRYKYDKTLAESCITTLARRIDWKTASILTAFIFGSVLAVFSLYFAMNIQDVADQCYSDVRILLLVYGFFSILTPVFYSAIVVILSKREMTYYRTYILGIGLKPLPNINNRNGKFDRTCCKHRRGEVTLRLDNISHLIDISSRFYIVYFIYTTLVVAWSIITLVFAGMCSNDSAFPGFNVWSFLGPVLALAHIALQLLIFFYIRPRSLKIDVLTHIYLKNVIRLDKLIQTNGQSWESTVITSTSESDTESGTESDSESESSCSEDECPRDEKSRNKKSNKHSSKNKTQKSKSQTKQPKSSNPSMPVQTHLNPQNTHVEKNGSKDDAPKNTGMSHFTPNKISNNHSNINSSLFVVQENFSTNIPTTTINAQSSSAHLHSPFQPPLEKNIAPISERDDY